VEARPAFAHMIAAAGHLIGNHSYSHADMTRLGDDELRADVRRAEEAIERSLGVSPRPWFRLPYGNGESDARVLAGLRDCGYRGHVHWNVVPRDWEPRVRPRHVLKRVVSETLDQSPPAVVLLHTWSSATAAAVPRIIRALRRKGAQFVRLDEMISEPSTDE
jgi:peptidoglycan/xylan/chitin deacetylase (PgdA/CDA1 family)